MKEKRKKIINFLSGHLYIAWLALPFLMMDVFMRILGHDIHYFQPAMVFPNIMFVLLWIAMFLGIALNLNSKAGKVSYMLIFLLYFVFFLVHGIYYSLTGFFFSFHLMTMAGEGSSYILDTILHTNPLVYLAGILVLLAGIFAVRKIPKQEKCNIKRLLIIVTGFIVLHMFTPSFLGPMNESLEWDTWRNPRNVYENFNDANKTMKICGLYEYTFRDFYVTFLKEKETDDEEELAFLEETYATLTTSKENEYTGLFEGKNVIFLQLEGIDDWLLNEEDMPTLYGMLDHSIVFENHYSYYNGGGSTFNSELAVNTGFITPISYVRNAYSFNTNLFPYSLANLFKERNYRVNAFHMNTREYYSRGINYTNWGYDHYYGLLDENNYDDLSYELDRELIMDNDFYERMFRQEGNFMHYIITYTPHTPFTTTKGMGKLLAEKVYQSEEIPDLSEEESARLYAGETDKMVELLLESLEENGLLDNTVIVAYADHYLYTLQDKTILDKYKNTDNNLINHTPFFIWSNGMEKQTVEKVNSQLDILPTVLNLFGIEYIPEYYMGNDIFNPDYSGYVFFSDYSWYDGNVYVEDGVITNDGQMDEAKVQEMNDKINRLIQKNDLTLKYDYLRKLK